MSSLATHTEQIQSHDAAPKQRIRSDSPPVRSTDVGIRQAPHRNRSTSIHRHPDVECEVSKWTGSRAKRFVDFSAALFLLLLLAPVFCIVYIAVRTGSRGPAIFNQERVGRDQSRFTIHKFRTMLHAPGCVSHLRSKQRDSRLTAQGSILRNYKLDELPQLINVLRGEMSLVGPRPLLPEHSVCRLSCRPGLTGRASIAFAREAELVANVPEHLLEEFHSSFITPLKLQLDREYIKHATFTSDLRVILDTILRRGCYRELTPVDRSQTNAVDMA